MHIMVVKHQQGKVVDKKYLFYFIDGELKCEMTES